MRQIHVHFFCVIKCNAFVFLNVNQSYTCIPKQVKYVIRRRGTFTYIARKKDVIISFKSITKLSVKHKKHNLSSMQNVILGKPKNLKKPKNSII